jgi:hypothetical protein
MVDVFGPNNNDMTMWLMVAAQTHRHERMIEGLNEDST